MRSYKMSWDATNCQWQKMFKGSRIRVTCQQLGLPRERWTKQESYLSANAWWDAHRGTISVPMSESTVVDVRLQWARANAPEEVGVLEKAKKTRTHPDDVDANIVKRILEENGCVIPDDLDPVIFREVFGGGAVWEDRLGRESAVSKENTVGGMLDSFKAVKLAKKIKPKTYREVAMVCDQLKEFEPALTRKMDVKNLNESCVRLVYQQFSKLDLEEVSKKKRWNIFKSFVRFCYMEGKIDLPRNLDSTDYKFEAHVPAVKVVPLDVLRAELAKLSPRLKLWALLGLNCGMTNCDIGLLTPDMVGETHLTRGREKRKDAEGRSKKGALTVSYKLWPETLELLRRFKSKGAFWFMSEAGTPMYESRIDDNDKVAEKDLVGQAWKKGKSALQLKQFRSIGASLLESHEHYGRYKTHFLAQRPTTIADKHYAAPDADLFNTIMTWMRGKIFG